MYPSSAHPPQPSASASDSSSVSSSVAPSVSASVSPSVVPSAAHVYLVDNLDTDRIIPGKYTKTLDLSSLAAHVLEDLDPEFAQKVRAGDFLVAGNNFGCGSSREQAPLALKAAGISVVIAKSFARIFYRNAINIGLPVMEVKHNIQPGDSISVELENGLVTNHTRNETYRAAALPPQMMNILREGGLVNYLLKYGDYV